MLSWWVQPQESATLGSLSNRLRTRPGACSTSCEKKIGLILGRMISLTNCGIFLASQPHKPRSEFVIIQQVIDELLHPTPLFTSQMAKSKSPKLESAENPVAWIDGPNSYKLGLQNGKVVCQNAKGNQLATLPAALKEDPTADQLQALASWLDDHRLECLHTVERWMLRSLIIPRQLLIEVWPDPDWKTALSNMVIAPSTSTGKVDREQYGLLKDADAVKAWV